MALVGVILGGVVLALLGYQIFESLAVHRSFKSILAEPLTGPDALVGKVGEVVGGFEQSGPDSGIRGRVRIGGESWEAEFLAPPARSIAAGEEVRVVGFSRGILKVISC